MVLQPASTCAGIGEDAGSSADLGPTVAGGPVPAWSGMCATPPGTATTGGCAGDLGGPVLGADHDLVGVVEGVPGPGPGGFADVVCGSHVRVIALAPVLPWIVQLP